MAPVLKVPEEDRARCVTCIVLVLSASFVASYYLYDFVTSLLSKCAFVSNTTNAGDNQALEQAYPRTGAQQYGKV
jgi:hypothetical protein